MNNNIMLGRNHCLDFCKGCACIAVVFMHCEFPGMFGILIQCLTRFAVPLFFIISGFFSCSTKENSTIGFMKIKNIFNTIMFAYFIYFAFTIVKNCVLDGMPIDAFLLSRLTFKDWIQFLIFNQPIVVAGHLWFLFALLYCYLLWMLLQNQKCFLYSKLVPIIIGGGLILHFLIGQGLYLMTKQSIDSCYYRNFLFEGIPFFLSGVLLRHYKQTKRLYYITNKMLSVVFLLGCIFSVIERIAIGRDFSLHIGALLQVFAVMVYAVNNPANVPIKFIEIIGRKYSQDIYIIHMVIFAVIEIALNFFNIGQSIFIQYLLPVLVVSGSLIGAMFLSRLRIVVMNLFARGR